MLEVITSPWNRRLTANRGGVEPRPDLWRLAVLALGITRGEEEWRRLAQLGGLESWSSDVDDTVTEKLESLSIDGVQLGLLWDCLSPLITTNGTYTIILTDLVMPDIDGIEVLKKVKQQNSNIDVIVMTSYGTVTNAVEAMKLGAADYLTKPFKRDELIIVIEKILQLQRLEGEVDRLRSELAKKYTFGNIIGDSPKIKKIYEIIYNVSNTEANILIQGETGTGKQLVARAIHYNSARKDHPFVKVDCASLAEALLESELFGHEKGAFTGATKDRIGRFRTADRGTIFLDEIGNISVAVQAKLLRVLQDSEFEAVGSDEPIKINVRTIAATNADIEDRVEKGLFRRDLFYRLNVIRILLPSSSLVVPATIKTRT